MDIVSLFLIAFGLSMDSFAVSITSGLALIEVRLWSALRVGLCFGLFQGIMPILGWLAGMTLKRWIVAFDHWIAFFLLGFVGAKMIVESLKLEKRESPKGPLGNGALMTLGVATSIDAMAVGISFAFLKVTIATPALVIGSVTCALSVMGVYIGRKVGHLLKKKMEVVGGLILIGIGFKILMGHVLS